MKDKYNIEQRKIDLEIQQLESKIKLLVKRKKVLQEYDETARSLKNE